MAGTVRLGAFFISGLGAAVLVGGPVWIAMASSGDDERLDVTAVAFAVEDSTPEIATPEWTGEEPPIPETPEMWTVTDADIASALEVAQHDELVLSSIGSDFEVIDAVPTGSADSTQRTGTVLVVRTPSPVALPAGMPTWVGGGESGEGELRETVTSNPSEPVETFELTIESGADGVRWVVPVPPEIAEKYDVLPQYTNEGEAGA